MKHYKASYVKQFQELFWKVRMIDVKRLTPVVDELKLLEEFYALKQKV